MLMIEFINESFFILVCYHMICFTLIVMDAKMRSDMGISCVAFTSVIIAINLFVMLAKLFQAIKLLIKRQCAKRKFRKMLK